MHAYISLYVCVCMRGQVRIIDVSMILFPAVGLSTCHSLTAACSQPLLHLLHSHPVQVLFIDEAYGLDPKRSGNTYAGSVLDTLVEKLDGGTGADICVIMAGYQPQMEELFRNCGNPGLVGRMNLDQALLFEDYDDVALRVVLKRLVLARGLSMAPATLDFAVGQMARKRKLDGFRNAAEAGLLLDRATLKMTARKTAAAASNAAIDPTLVLVDDCISEETSADKAFDVFAGLENMEHVIEFLRKRKALLEMAKTEGKDPAELLSKSHMVFVGPPGTGKTLAALRFGKVFKQLDLLPRDTVECTLGSTLIDRYVGGTSNNVLKVMRRAKNGILFIDEVYSLGNSTYGLEALQALLDNITAPEFYGKLIVIIAGYKADVERLFTVNPGFQSRFDKQRIEFPEWTADIATRATVSAIERDGKSLTPQCRDCLPQLYAAMRSLPNWASARDVYEIIMPSLYEARAVRHSVCMQQRRQLGQPDRGSDPFPYEEEDARGVFGELLARRGGSGVIPLRERSSLNTALDRARRKGQLLVLMLVASWSPEALVEQAAFLKLQQRYPAVVLETADFNSELGALSEKNTLPAFLLFDKGEQLSEHAANVGELVTLVDEWQVRAGAMQLDGLRAAPAPCRVTVKVKEREKKLDPVSGDDGSDEPLDDPDLWASLEAACAAMGMSLAEIEAMLQGDDFPTSDLLAKLTLPAGTDLGRAKAMLRRQKPQVLSKIRESIKEAQRRKTAEEEAVLAKVRKIGRCPMGFEWIKIDGGYRCGGGSHTVTDIEIANFMADG
jgi:SpoVK/Ycf46/Vps4 family AAA+-type ATPase/DNA-binding transcriptional MerR regulator